MFKLKHLIIVYIAISGCAFTKPEPPMPTGLFRPINPPKETVQQAVERPYAPVIKLKRVKKHAK